VNKTLDQQNLETTVSQRGKPSTDSFSRLLKWLDGDMDSHGLKYEEMRRRLISYFDRKDCGSPDDLADETLNRVMKWLEQAGKDYDSEPAKICYNTARFVFHEYLRRPDREHENLEEVSTTLQLSGEPRQAMAIEEEQWAKERRLGCLDRCAQQLATDDRDLIVRYYHGEQRVKLNNRKALAAERKITANALSIKACRIRDKLRGCVTGCLSK
jgi:DNA-directed RNA polymerase specialized sigma24 family protein